MKSLVFTGPNAIEIQERDKPVPKAGEYLVKILANGVCGSDVEGFRGISGRRIPPMIMGHEFAGVIEEAPSNGKYATGQKVIAFPKLYCGECETCNNGYVNICPGAPCLGVLDCDGTFTEYISLKEKYIIPFREELSFEDACMVEPLAVAVRGSMNIPQETLQKAQNLLIIGAGTIGLLLIQAIRLRGYSGNLVVNDRSSLRLEKALEVGADATFTGNDFNKEVLSATGGEKFDVVVECVGLEITAQSSLDSLKSGGTAVWIGNNQKMIEINMQQIVTSEIKIRGSYTYLLEDFHNALKYIEDGKIILQPIITSTLALEKGVEAFDILTNNSDGKEIKVILINK